MDYGEKTLKLRITARMVVREMLMQYANHRNSKGQNIKQNSLEIKRKKKQRELVYKSQQKIIVINGH